MANKIAGVPSSQLNLFICDCCDREASVVWLLNEIRVCGDCRFRHIRKQWLIDAWRTWSEVGDETIETSNPTE